VSDDIDFEFKGLRFPSRLVNPTKWRVDASRLLDGGLLQGGSRDSTHPTGTAGSAMMSMIFVLLDACSDAVGLLRLGLMAVEFTYDSIRV
jgi:hypothetical protein